MPRPADPYQYRGDDHQQHAGGQPYGAPHRSGETPPHGWQPQAPAPHQAPPAYRGQPGYQQPPGYRERPGYHRQPGYQEPPGYQEQPAYQRQPVHQPPAAGPRHQAPAPRREAPRPPAAGPRRSMRPSMRLPGIGLLLTLVSLAVQLLSLTVLPWLRLTAAEPGSATTPKVWQLVADLGTQGFSGWYVVLFSYPLAVLSIVLALASVLESVAMKMIWAGLSLLGLGWLAVRYGVLPLTDGGGEGFTRPQLVVTAVAIVALVLVIFMLRTAVATFRRLAGLILLGIAGVHIAAIADLAGDPAGGLNLGAYGPALAYLLAAIAAFIGPRRLVGG